MCKGETELTAICEEHLREQLGRRGKETPDVREPEIPDWEKPGWAPSTVEEAFAPSLAQLDDLRVQTSEVGRKAKVTLEEATFLDEQVLAHKQWLEGVRDRWSGVDPHSPATLRLRLQVWWSYSFQQRLRLRRLRKQARRILRRALSRQERRIALEERQASEAALAAAERLQTAAALPRREPIPTRVKNEVWRRDQRRCVECGSQERLEFDHIIPLSRGGSNTARNIQLLCERCNRSKGARI